MTAGLATEIKSYAGEELGFELIGITTAAPLPGGEHLARWLADGRHGEMAYMAKTAAGRAEPARLLPGAQSVICVALSYHDEPEPPQLRPERERVVVARYARRSDYHKAIKRRLARLGRFLAERAPEAAWRVATDTAPLLEKELAQRAGLGWIGKNTCLVNRRLGSEVLLGELLTSVALPADEPESDGCGTCAACLETCPTRALEGPHRLDARRCISYLTIEHRGALPAALLPALGAHLFGCDICQAVCPWNHHAFAACAPVLRERPGLDALSLSKLECLDETGWAALTAGTPLRRLDFPRFRRNLAAVTLNAKGASAIGSG